MYSSVIFVMFLLPSKSTSLLLKISGSYKGIKINLIQKSKKKKTPNKKSQSQLQEAGEVLETNYRGFLPRSKDILTGNWY